MLDRFKNVSKSTLICFIIVIFMILFVLFTGNKDYKEKVKNNNVDIIELFNKIPNNYELTITKTINDSIEEYSYYTDGNLELFSSSSLDIGYIYYNNKTYLLNSNTMKISIPSDIPNYVNDPYSNFKLLKSVINKCDFEYINSNKVNCRIKESDFINEINTFYNKNYDINSTNNLDILINYNNNINLLDINYTSINSIINNSNDLVKYKIKISNIGLNDFNQIYEHFKNELK